MCPFVDAAEAHCADHLTLDHLALALEHCADRFHECPVYREMTNDARHRQPDDRRSVRIAG